MANPGFTLGGCANFYHHAHQINLNRAYQYAKCNESFIATDSGLQQCFLVGIYCTSELTFYCIRACVEHYKQLGQRICSFFAKPSTPRIRHSLRSSDPFPFSFFISALSGGRLNYRLQKLPLCACKPESGLWARD